MILKDKITVHSPHMGTWFGKQPAASSRVLVEGTGAWGSLKKTSQRKGCGLCRIQVRFEYSRYFLLNGLPVCRLIHVYQFIQILCCALWYREVGGFETVSVVGPARSRWLFYFQFVTFAKFYKSINFPEQDYSLVEGECSLEILCVVMV